MAEIDHFMWAVADLDEGLAWAEQTFGVQPAAGGSHIGLGTRNALLSFGDTYLEIIAPDPAQELAGTMGNKLAQLRNAGLSTWAARGPLQDIATTLTNRGLACRGPVATQRATPSGDMLRWELLFPDTTQFGPVMPFFIDWLDCPHPAAVNPEGGTVHQFTISSPEAAELRATFEAIDLRGSIESGARHLLLQVETANGLQTLESNEQTLSLW